MVNDSQEVYWNDPDDGVCSGWYTITEVIGDVVRLTNEEGLEVEAFTHELS